MSLRMPKFMSPFTKIIIKSTILITTALVTLFVVVVALDDTLTQNISISEPIGYYVKLPRPNKIQRGQKYLICVNNNRYIHILKRLGLPSSSGECAGNLPYLIKQVVGISGDVIEITASGVLINNKLQPNSKSFTFARGINLYPLPIGYKTILHKDEYFVLGITPHSVDSRYFGIVKRNQIYKQVFLIF